MRKLLFLMLPLFLLSLATAVLAMDRIEPPEACPQCGMSRAMNAQSRMLVVYTDQSRIGTCSLHCMATELKAHRGDKAVSLQVADYYSHKLIGARKAAWVLGGDKKGVMTSTPKWAFVSEAEAKRFVATSGGRLASFEEALSLAEQE